MAVGIRVVCPQCRLTFRIESEVQPGTAMVCVCGAQLVVPEPQDQGAAIGTATLAGSSDDRCVTLDAASGETRTLAQPDPNATASVEELLRASGSASGRYVEQGIIGKGGMGEIVLCIDRDIRRPVAMKRMLTTTAGDPSRRARFIEEAQVTGQLEHPNIVPVHELTRRDDGTVYFTMKLVKGKSLADTLAEAKGGKAVPSLGELLQVFLKVCDGVAFAHSRGVLHRDLKPANIMVGDYGEVLVMDWGLAKVKGREDIRSEDIVGTSRVERADTRTMEGSMIGTPAYMPPEQAEGKLDQIDERSDVYSLGAILYEMLALERGIQGETQMAVIVNVVHGRIVPPERRAPGRNIPREVSAIAMKCLSKLRARRYRSVMELRRDIGLFLEGRSVSAAPDTFGQAVVKLAKRNKGVSAAVGAAAVVLITMGAIFTYDNAQKRRTAEGALVLSQENERKATAARKQQRETALAASERFARQAALAAENYRWAEANERLGDAQAVCPDGPWAPCTRGRFAQIKGDHEGAVKLFNDALKIAPGQPDIASARDKSASLLQGHAPGIAEDRKRQVSRLESAQGHAPQGAAD